MTKLSKLIGCLVLALTMIGCTAKTKVDLNTVVFDSIYVGEESGAIPGAMMTMNLTESNHLKYHLDLPSWSKIDSATAEELAKSVLVMIDTNGNQFTFYDTESRSFLKIKGEKSSPIYYSYDHSVKELIQTDMARLIYGLVLKDRIKSMFFNQAETDIKNATSFSRFSLPPEACDTVIELMDIDNWLLVGDHQTQAPWQPLVGLLSVTNYELLFNLSRLDGKPQVWVRHRVGDQDIYDTYSLGDGVYDRLKAKLIQIQADVQVKPGDVIKSATFNKAVVYSPSSDIIAATVELAPSESDSVKLSMSMDLWVKQSDVLSLEYPEVTLETEGGLKIVIGQSQIGPIAVVTSSTDSSFKEVYGLPDNVGAIVMDVLSYDESSLPPATMISFVPVKLTIMDVFDEFGESKFRTYTLNAMTTAELKSILYTENWTKDPDPDRYAFGWIWKYALEDKEGRTLHVYNYGAEWTPVYVEGFFPVSDGGIWYDGPGSLIKRLADYIGVKFPKP